MAHTALIPFQNGLKWGFKDLAGNTSIEPLYDMASPFKHGISVVIKEGKAGLLNTSGEYILEPVHDAIEPWDDAGMYLFRENGKTGMVSYRGEILSPPVFDGVGEFSEGLFPALKDNYWGFYNGRLQEVIPSVYHSAKKFRYGVAEVSDPFFTVLIDRHNKVVIDPGMVYADEEHLSRYTEDNMAAHCRHARLYGEYFEVAMTPDGGRLLFTLEGKLVTGKMFESFHACGDGYLITGGWPRVELAGRHDCTRYGVINLRGDQILPLIFEELKYLGSNAFAFRINEKWGVINPGLEVLVEPRFNYPPGVEGGLVVRRDRASLIVNTRGDHPESERVETDLIKAGFRSVKFEGETAFYDSMHDIDPEYSAHDSFGYPGNSVDEPGPDDESLVPGANISHGSISRAALQETVPEPFEIDGEIYDRLNIQGPDFSLEDLERPETWMLPDGDDLSFTRAFKSTLEWAEGFSERSGKENVPVELARDILRDTDYMHDCDLDEIFGNGDSESPPFGDGDDPDDFDEENDEKFAQYLREKGEEFDAETNNTPRQDETTVTFRMAGMLLDTDGEPSAVVYEQKLEKWGKGVYFAYESDHTFGSATIRNSNFEVILPGLHPVVNDRRRNGKYFRVTLAGKYGLIDREGRLVLDPVFRSLSRFIKGTAIGLTDDAVVVIDESFNFRYLEIEAVNFSSFDGETFAIAVDGARGTGWGLITTSDEEVLPFRYQLLRRVSSKYLVAKRSGRFGVIDTKGNEVVPFIHTGYSAPFGRYLPLLSNTGLYTLFNSVTGKMVDSFKAGRHRHHLAISGIKRLSHGYHLLRLEKETEYVNPAAPPRDTRIMVTPPPDLDGLI